MLLLLVGLLAILSQIVLLRELNVAFYGVELVYALALAVWMAGNAAGSLFGRRRSALGGRGEAWLLAGAAALLPLDVAWIRGSRWLLGGIPGAYLPFGHQLLVLALALLPPAILLGLAFRWAAERASLSGRSLGRSYAIESAGACVGGFGTTLALATGAQTLALALVAACLVPAFLVALEARRGADPPSRLARASWLTTAALLVTATVAGEAASRRLDLAMTAWTHPAVIESRDSAYARITATKAGSQTALFVDDVLVYESEAVQQEELAHVAALAHPRPSRILVLGGSVSGIDRELAKHAPRQLVVVELDRAYVEAGRRFGVTPNVVVDDPRRFLNRPGQYDLIVVATPQPTSGQANRFYTKEFFEECRTRLAPDGILALALDLPENVVSPVAAARTSSILAAAWAAFPFVEALHGSSAIVLASSSPLPRDARPMIERWNERRLDVRLVTPAYLRYLFENDRRLELETMLRATPARPNSDARPVCYQLAEVGWLARFFPQLLTLRPGAGGMAGLATALGTAALVIVVVSMRFGRAASGLLAGLAGFAGMLLETVLLLAYQARSGALFEWIGLLLLAFMSGLAIGAALVGRLIGRLRTAPGPTSRVVARWTCAALVLLSALVAWSVTGPASGLLPTAALMCASGGLVASVFASVAADVEAARRATGHLYAADLLGGAAGSLLAGLLLVPMFGLVATAWVVAGAGLLGMLLAR